MVYTWTLMKVERQLLFKNEFNRIRLKGKQIIQSHKLENKDAYLMKVERQLTLIKQRVAEVR